MRSAADQNIYLLSESDGVAYYPPAPAPIPEVASAGRNELETTHTILLVEDETFVRKAVGEALQSAGFDVLLAANAAEALKIQQNESETIDLLLADVVMPNVSGHELARKFLALSPHTEVLLMSGYEEQVIRCEQAPQRTEYLAKPFPIPTLLQRVRLLLNRRSCRNQPPA